MNKEYEDFVLKLMSPASIKNFEASLAAAALGLAGESGEFADQIKKILFHGKDLTEELKKELALELGDCLFYITFAARQILNLSLEDIVQLNVDKLSSRYKDGVFSKEAFMVKENLKNGK